MNEPRPDEPKLKSIDIKIQAAARRAEQERNAGPKVLDPESFERDEHLPDGTIRPTPPKKYGSGHFDNWTQALANWARATQV